MRPAQWDYGQIQRLTFRLPDQEPIHYAEVRYRTEAETGLDMHYPLECGIILSGRMRRFYEGHQMDLDPGDAWCCGIWEPHGFRVVRTPCRCVVLVINPAMLMSLRYDETPELNLMAPFLAAPNRRPGRGTARNELLRLAKRMQEAASFGDPQRRLFLRLHLQELLVTLLRDWKPASARAMRPPAEPVGRLHRAVDMVFASSRYVSVQAAARNCGMSRNRFSSLFRQWMGLRFPEFALRHRVSGAAKQLLRSGDPLKAVAQDWGFTDASHLHRCFRKYYGCGVSEYRQRAHRTAP